MPVPERPARVFKSRILKRAVLAAFLAIGLYGLSLPRTTPALATHCGVGCDCVESMHNGTRNWITVRHADTQLYIGNEMIYHRQAFWIDYFFNEHVLAALMLMTEQLVTTAMHQTLAIGAFFDAKHQLETQQMFQTMMARAHKDYQPSTEMCVVGTSAKSLASAQRRGEANSYALAQLGIERSLNSVDTNAGTGPKEDKEGRIDLFKTTFCDERDNNNSLGALCDGSGPAQSQNMDVDFAGLVDRPWTIDTNLTDSSAGGQDAAVIAMYQYLYGHNVFTPIAGGPLSNQQNQDVLLDVRAVAAKRAVAQQSFASLIGQKSSGTADSADTQRYMRVLMREFGITDDAEIDEIIGERPSYFAQMEVLTKQILMREQFYTNLYDTPANIDRRGAAIQALGLVQNMDLFESKLRNEAMLAVLVELKLGDLQDSVENRMRLLEDDSPIKVTPGP